VITDISTTLIFYIIADNSAGTVRSLSSASGTPYILGEAPSLTVTPILNSSGAVRITYTQANTGTIPVTYYYTTTNNANTAYKTQFATPTIDVYGVTGQTTYYVIASNNAGNIISTGLSVTPYLFGSKPVISSISQGTNSLTVEFTGSSGGNPSTFTYYYSYDGITREPGPITSPFTITGLTTQKNIYIIANNLAGDISSNPLTATPYLLGTKPLITNITPGANRLTVTFSGSTGGNPSTFTYYYSYDGIIREPGQVVSPFTITGLTTQKTIYIIANNLAGDISSNSLTSTPYFVGTSPFISNVMPGINRLTVTFTDSSGGYPAPNYYYSLNGGTLTPVPLNQNPFDILNLTQAISNSVYVLARNNAGDVSSNVVSAIPYVIGSAPTITKITPITNGLNIEFTGSVGGYPSPTTYYYTVDGGSAVNANTTSSPITIQNLTIVKEYAIQIYSQNLAGISPQSNVLTGTPLSGSQTEVITPATYWKLQYWTKPSFWKKSYWSKKRK
jgi:uncharacterized lipoprotein YehR (DUF1307 family)